ncbi:AMP-binding protein, partial [Mycobacterium sp. 852002-30065_SCH5024008]|uniref:AMP-binding protein n=1 Tax=Mycobacterium sp. 852002-30065_SCH5024008 TaxID=1834088 RepID=UPI0012E6FF9E
LGLLSSVEVLDAQELACLEGWGNRAVLNQPMAAAVSIPAAFAAQVASTPEAVALTFGNRSWTYRDVDEAANRLAHLLVARGVGPGECVGLLFPRCADAIVAMLAVLKAGGSYVPIDPAWPAARMEFVLVDATPVAVITTAELRSRLEGSNLLVVDVHDRVVDAQATSALPWPAPENIAYIIYTSGTTGTPKGVAIANYTVMWLAESLESCLPAGQVWTQCHSSAFDFSVWEIFG